MIAPSLPFRTPSAAGSSRPTIPNLRPRNGNPCLDPLALSTFAMGRGGMLFPQHRSPYPLIYDTPTALSHIKVMPLPPGEWRTPRSAGDGDRIRQDDHGNDLCTQPISDRQATSRTRRSPLRPSDGAMVRRNACLWLSAGEHIGTRRGGGAYP